MDVFAKIDGMPSMLLQDTSIKKPKRNGHTVGRTDNVKSVYLHTNTVFEGIITRPILITKRKSKIIRTELKIQEFGSRKSSARSTIRLN